MSCKPLLEFDCAFFVVRRQKHNKKAILIFLLDFSLRFALFIYVYMCTSILSHCVKKHLPECASVIIYMFYSLGISYYEYHLWIIGKKIPIWSYHLRKQVSPMHLLFVFYNCSLCLWVRIYWCFKVSWQYTQCYYFTVILISLKQQHPVWSWPYSPSINIELFFLDILGNTNHEFLGCGLWVQEVYTIVV